MLARWIRPRMVLLATWMIVVLLGCIWLSSPGSLLFVVLCAAFGFLWMFVVASGLSYIVAVDPSRQSIAYLPTAQPLGSAAGPLLASLAVNGADVRGAIIVAVASLSGGIAIVALSPAGGRQLRTTSRADKYIT
jgi:MFS transporter, DHA1 family, inner membrane transport protein